MGQTYTWLERHFKDMFEAVHFTGQFSHNGGQITKGEVCRELGVTFFVDDAPHHIDDVASVVENVLLFNTPWNQNYEIKSANVTRVNSWNEIHTLFTHSTHTD